MQVNLAILTYFDNAWCSLFPLKHYIQSKLGRQVKRGVYKEISCNINASDVLLYRGLNYEFNKKILF